MSVTRTSVQWTPLKRRIDLVLAAGVALALATFAGVTVLLRPEATVETILLRSLAVTALALLHVVLAAGPLARLDRRFLPLLYNRRHLGVVTFLLGAAHAALVVVQHHAQGDRPALVSLLASGGYELLGALALVVLFALAATSHDFWLAVLTPATWKALHLGVFVAYGALVAHVAFGALQSERALVPVLALGAGAAALVVLHLVTARREATLDESRAAEREGFADVAALDELREGRGRVVIAGGTRLALFRQGDRVHATSNACRHQGGPLGEGRIVDGCITCPWHGWQYRPEDGCSPPPFREVVETHEVRIARGRVLVRVAPRPLGATQESAA